MRYPVNQKFRVSLKYGATTPPYSPSNPHNGTDLVSEDRRIVAPEDGKVTYYANTNGNSGWMLVLMGASGHRHSFSHTVAGSNKVAVGTNVKKGQDLATMGSTGNAQGVHVHWVVDSGSVDPESIVNEGGNMSYTPVPIDPKLVSEHYANYTNGAVSLKPSDPACQNRFELNDPNWGGEFWRGLNNQQLDIIKGRDAEIAALKKQIADGIGGKLEPAAEVNGKVTLWKEKSK